MFTPKQNMRLAPHACLRSLAKIRFYDNAVNVCTENMNLVHFCARDTPN